MADTIGGVETVGFEEFIRDVERLPEAVTERLRAVARRTALNVKAGAERRLPEAGQTEYATGLTRKSIVVRPEVEQKQYRVDVDPRPHLRNGKPVQNWQLIPEFIEYGTVHKEGAPFMRPAADEQDEPYRAAIEAALSKPGLID